MHPDHKRINHTTNIKENTYGILAFPKNKKHDKAGTSVNLHIIKKGDSNNL